MQAGFAEANITPPPGEEMTGYGYYRNRRALGALDPLMARALALSEGDARAVVVQLDLLGLSREFVAGVREDAGRRFGLPPECLLLHCTHTHSGPGTMTLWGCGSPGERFLGDLQNHLLSAIERALADLRPASAAGTFEGDFTEGFAYNRAGLPDLDTRIRGLRIECAGARPILVLSYACHPVTLGANPEYSADYCGAAVREFAAYGVRTLFLNGPCGDINPLGAGTGTRETLQIYGRDFAVAAKSAMRSMREWNPGPIRAASRSVPYETAMPDAAGLRRALDACREALRANPGDGQARVGILWHEAMLRALADGTLPEEARAEIQAIACGDVLFVGMSAETFTRLGSIIREGVPGRHLMIAATSNGVRGYLATREDVERGAYASLAACKIYAMPLPAPGAGEGWAAAGAGIARSAAGLE